MGWGMTIGRMEDVDSRSREGPVWLERFLTAKYFTHCSNHGGEKNHFCIDCIVGPLCPSGLMEHTHHRTLQIRRASHFDAVRIMDIHKLLDISQIQTYVINSARIVFLLRRPQQKVAKDWSNACRSCGRSLTEPVLYCSIGCKLFGVKEHFDDPDLTLTRAAKTMHSRSPLSAVFPLSCPDDYEGIDQFLPWIPVMNRREKDSNWFEAENTPVKNRKHDAHNRNKENLAYVDIRPMKPCNQSPPNSSGLPLSTAGSPLRAESFDSTTIPSTPQNSESASLRVGHKRKGTPCRAPFA